MRQRDFTFKLSYCVQSSALCEAVYDLYQKHTRKHRRVKLVVEMGSN